MEFSTILVTALSTGFATAVLNQLFGWWRESRKEVNVAERDARYIAIRLAVILERFALDCAEAIAAQEMFDMHDGHAGKPHGKLPDLAPYPDEVDWKTLKPEFLARALTLRNELILSDASIEFWEDIDRTTVSGECDWQCGKCGYMAWTLAAEMRARYALGAFEPDKSAWNAVKTLKEYHDKVLHRAVENAMPRSRGAL